MAIPVFVPLLIRGAQAAIVAGTAYAAAYKLQQYRLDSQPRAERQYAEPLVVIKPNMQAISDEQLKAAQNYFNGSFDDYVTNTFTGEIITRFDVEQEVLRRGNSGGFLFVNSYASAALAIGAFLQLKKGAEQLWGWINSRPERSGPPALDEELQGVFTGTVPPEGNTAAGTLTISWEAGAKINTALNPSNGICSLSAPDPYGAGSHVLPSVVRAAPFATLVPCGVGSIGVEYWLSSSPETRREWILFANGGGMRNIGPIGLSWSGPNATTYTEPTGEPLPMPEGFYQPEVVPRPLTLPSLIPAPEPAPITTPVPLTEPQEEPKAPPLTPWPPIRPGPAAPPTPRPGPSPTPIEPGPDVFPPPRRKLPPDPRLPILKNPRPIGPDGRLKPADPANPQPTPVPDKIIGPVIIRTPIGVRPRPTPRGTATELARIEAKLEVLLNPPAQGPDWTGAIRQLLDLLSVLSSQTTYTLEEVCPPDGEQPAEFEWPVPGVPVMNLGIAARLDALAEMIQVHKNLRQPICRHKPQGQPVQVQFIQSETEWEPNP